MSKICKLDVNGTEIPAQRGELLLDAALMNGVDIPHDCRSGYCGTCRVRVLAGRSVGGASDDPEIVHACQARIVSDMRIEVEDVPDVLTIAGRVAQLVPRAPDVTEVCVATAHPLYYLPGQYCSVKFAGYPARCYSPTAPLDWPSDNRLLRFHIRRIADGRVSSAIGARIGKGHRVKITGPLGSAFLRDYRSRRLVLIAGGTGFAPIWSIAEAAITEMPRREMVLVVGARTLESLYMIPALCRIALFPNVSIFPVVAESQSITRAVRQGSPLDYLPSLSSRDVVYCAGAPAMVEAVARAAVAAGAKCHSDPFEPAPQRDRQRGLLSRASEWLEPELPAAPSLSMADWLPRNRQGAVVPLVPEMTPRPVRKAADEGHRLAVSDGETYPQRVVPLR